MENLNSNHFGLNNSLDKNVKNLNLDNIINQIPLDNEVLLLGECTHGTHEFYELRSQITKYLIENKGYNLVLLEGEWNSIYPINEYINNNNNLSLQESMVYLNKYPSWMWNNKVTKDLFQWMREYNNKNGKLYPTNIFGIDCQSFYPSLEKIFQFLGKVDVLYSGVLKSKLSFLFKYDSERTYSQQIVNGELSKHSLAIQNLLQSIYSEVQWEKTDKYMDYCKNNKINPIEAVAFEQNFEILINGEEYFKKMLLEPPGSRASWNTRDQHMTMTILRLKDKLENISKNKQKVIVWAHNSHVGDSMSTSNGSQTFDQNNSWNLGQMTRSMFEKTHIIGFYTYNGTVRASSEWGCQDKVYDLNNAIKYSSEYFLHNYCCYSNKHSFILDLTKYKRDKIIYEPSKLPYEHIVIIPSNSTQDFELSSSTVKEYKAGDKFIAIERRVDNKRYGLIRLKIDNGSWINECSPLASITYYCVKSDYFNINTVNDLVLYPRPQRWVGVSYHPDSELGAHYGESHLSAQYDTIVYVDKTQALEL